MDEKTYKQYVSFVNYYIHQVNMMRHLLGEPYKVTYAEKSGVLLAVQSDSGVAGVIEMTPYRTTIDWEETLLVAFEKGYIQVRLPAPLANNRAGTVEVFTDPGNGATPQRTIPTPPLGPRHAPAGHQLRQGLPRREQATLRCRRSRRGPEDRPRLYPHVQ